jgi:BirA family biotin operon repressor/biotin-[acetyl-CoA-carboxylase] ligase
LATSKTPSASEFVSRLEHLESVASTQVVVREWLASGVNEVCVAVADQQTAGYGRLGRTWHAEPGRSLLASIGLRPRGVSLGHGWRLPAIISMAMLEAATALLGPTADRLALKWPNDIIAVHHGELLKLAGVVAEGSSQDQRMATSVIGIGVNVDWPKTDYPTDLAGSMWSLSEATGGRRVDRETLLSSWLKRLEPLYGALREGEFDADRWMAAQITTGAEVVVDRAHDVVRGIAVGLDDDSGALLVRSESGGQVERINHGDVVYCRLV